MKVFILIVLCLTATAVTGQDEVTSPQESVSSVPERSEDADGYGPERVKNSPSAPVTIPTAAAAAYAYSAAYAQPAAPAVAPAVAPAAAPAVAPVAAPARVPGQSAAAQPPMMLMPYTFQYGVNDDAIDLDFGHKESSDGLVVTGTYYVLLPDGRMETVNYKADDNGYVAEVIYDGEAKYDNAKPQKGAGSSPGTSAQLQAPSKPASAPAPPTRAPQSLPVSNATPKAPATLPTATLKAPTKAPPTASAPVWPAVKVPVVPVAPAVDRTPSVIPATSAPVAAPAPAPSAVPAPTAVWTQAVAPPPPQLSQVTTAQANTPPAGLVRPVVQPGVQAISYGQPSPSPPVPAPAPAYPVAPIPLTQRNTPKPLVNPY